MKNNFSSLKRKINKAADKKVLYSTHAINQMIKPRRMILKEEIREVINTGQVIENYPENKRGHSCLLWGKTEKKRIIHTVCPPKEGYLLIITAYIPNKDDWKNDFKTRKKEN